MLLRQIESLWSRRLSMWATQREVQRVHNRLQQQLLKIDGKLESTWKEAWAELKRLKEG